MSKKAVVKIPNQIPSVVKSQTQTYCLKIKRPESHAVRHAKAH